MAMAEDLPSAFYDRLRRRESSCVNPNHLSHEPHDINIERERDVGRQVAVLDILTMAPNWNHACFVKNR